MNTRNRTLAVYALLALAMGATRFHHTGSAIALPDASLAVFFLGGLALRGWRPFVLFLAEAGLIDYIAIAFGGVSDACVSPAYGFLLPAYGAMWAAGRWVAQQEGLRGRSFAVLSAALLGSVSLAFLISDGSFYLLSGYIATPSWSHYGEGVAHYFPAYLGSTAAYVAFAVFVRAVVGALEASRAAQSGSTGG